VPPNSEEEPPPLTIDAFHRVDEWRTQSALHLDTMGENIFALPSPLRSEPYDALERSFTWVATPALFTDGHRSNQSVSTSASSAESQLSRQDSYPSYPSLASPHASVALDAVHPRPA
jgi:hypothetical protein